MEVFTDINSGYKFCMKSNNESLDHMIKHGIFEYPLIEWSRQYLRNWGTFVDIGAHMGTYSIILSKHCKEVHSFEAQKSTYNGLQIGIMLNEKKNITTHNIALGSSLAQGTLYQVSEDGGGSTLQTSVINSPILAHEEVNINTLDSFQLKIDVEGHELEVLKGATQTLANNNYPPFIFEAWPDSWYSSQKELLFDFIKQLGYKIHEISGTNNMFLASDHPSHKII